jgi:hypothetical protein
MTTKRKTGQGQGPALDPVQTRRVKVPERSGAGRDLVRDRGPDLVRGRGQDREPGVNVKKPSYLASDALEK